jgi:hypothetical protein
MLLQSELWIGALIRRAEAGGAHAAVLRRGDARAGAVLVKLINRREGWARLFAEAVQGDGEAAWMEPVGAHTEPELDAYAERAALRDPDLWIVEIDDPRGRHFLTERVDVRRS